MHLTNFVIFISAFSLLQACGSGREKYEPIAKKSALNAEARAEDKPVNPVTKTDDEYTAEVKVLSDQKQEAEIDIEGLDEMEVQEVEEAIVVAEEQDQADALAEILAEAEAEALAAEEAAKQAAEEAAKQAQAKAEAEAEALARAEADARAAEEAAKQAKAEALKAFDSYRRVCRIQCGDNHLENNGGTEGGCTAPTRVFDTFKSGDVSLTRCKPTEAGKPHYTSHDAGGCAKAGYEEEGKLGQLSANKPPQEIPSIEVWKCYKPLRDSETTRNTMLSISEGGKECSDNGFDRESIGWGRISADNNCQKITYERILRSKPGLFFQIKIKGR